MNKKIFGMIFLGIFILIAGCGFNSNMKYENSQSKLSFEYGKEWVIATEGRDGVFLIPKQGTGTLTVMKQSLEMRKDISVEEYQGYLEKTLNFPKGAVVVRKEEIKGKTRFVVKGERNDSVMYMIQQDGEPGYMIQGIFKDMVEAEKTVDLVDRTIKIK